MRFAHYMRLRSLLVQCLYPAITAVMLCSCGEDKLVKYTETQMLESGVYQLRATHHMFPEPAAIAGGRALLNGKWIIVSGDGEFFLFERSSSGDDFQIARLPYSAPINKSRFLAEFSVDGHDENLPREFRVTDFAMYQSQGTLQLWLSHLWWNEQKACISLRVSSALADAEGFQSGKLSGLEWSTLYETTPCLPYDKTEFLGFTSGGEMALAGSPPAALYLTVGILDFGQISSNLTAQDPESSWGKVIKIDLQSGVASTFSSGHRNAQGLFIDDLGRIWLTEHGPRGGDELNLLEQGRNYGWPFATYGTEYDTYDPWPLSKNPGNHDGYQLPVYSWVPSIGVSGVIRLNGKAFPLWKGDLLVASLGAGSLFRIHLREGRAIVVEPILVNKRIRDVVEGPNGEIVLLTDNHRLIFIEPVPHQKQTVEENLIQP